MARDWFVLVDLKDADFHIQIAPCHRCFLGWIQMSCLSVYSPSFGLSLAPPHIHKVHECCSLRSVSELSVHSELFERLAAHGSLGECAGWAIKKECSSSTFSVLGCPLFICISAPDSRAWKQYSRRKVFPHIIINDAMSCSLISGNRGFIQLTSN